MNIQKGGIIDCRQVYDAARSITQAMNQLSSCSLSIDKQITDLNMCADQFKLVSLTGYSTFDSNLSRLVIMQKTLAQLQRETRDKKIYTRYVKLIQKGAIKTAVMDHLSKNLKVSPKTISNAIQRVQYQKARPKN